MAKNRVIVEYVSLMIFSGMIIPVVLADCDVEGMRCCVNEFLPLVSAESGFNLAEESLNRSCHVLDPTFQCFSDYEDQCLQTIKEEDMLRINDLKSYLTDLCSPGSKISNDIEERRQCILATSEKLMSCASKKDFRADIPWSKTCCEYKMLKACTEDTLKENCGDEESVLVRDMVKKINGLGYETLCAAYYETCGNSASSFASTLLFIFSAVVIITYAL